MLGRQTPGKKASPCRGTNRARRVSVLHEQPAFRKKIHIRSSQLRIAIAMGCPLGMVVSHDDEDIRQGRFRHINEVC